MKSQKTPLVLALALLFTMPPIANASETASSELSLANHQHTKDLVKNTHGEIAKVISGLRSFYRNNGAWPNNISSIAKYYTGDFETPVGTIIGSQSATGYLVSIVTSSLDDKMKAQLNSMALRSNGLVSGQTIQFTIDTPVSSEFTDNALSRFTDTESSGELNKMYADLNMNANNLTSIGNLNGSVLNAQTANVGTLNSTTITSDQAVIQNLTADTQNVANQSAVQVDAVNTTVSNQMTVLNSFTATSIDNGGVINAGGHKVIDGGGKLFYQGVDTDTLYLGIDSQAQDSDRLNGATASQFAKHGQANTFTAHQRFNNAVTASSVSATTVNISGSATGSNAYARTVEANNLKSNGEWTTTTMNRINNHTNRLNALKSKFNVSGKTYRLGRWYRTSSRTNNRSATTTPWPGQYCVDYGSLVYAKIGTEQRCYESGNAGDGNVRCSTVDSWGYLHCR